MYYKFIYFDYTYFDKNFSFCYTVTLAIDFIIKRYFNFQFGKREGTYCYNIFGLALSSSFYRTVRKGVDRNHLLSQSVGSGRDVGRVEWIRLATVRSGTVDHRHNRSRQARKSYCAANEHYCGIRIDSNLRYASHHEFIMAFQSEGMCLQ